MKKLMSLVLVAFVLSITSVGCSEPAKKADTGEKKREGGGPADKGTPTK